MLPCQDVCRHHQCALLARTAYSKHGEHGDHRFSAADIALQQRMELSLSVQSVDNAVESSLLTACQAEGESRLREHYQPKVNLPFVSTNLLVFAAFDHAQAEGE